MCAATGEAGAAPRDGDGAISDAAVAAVLRPFVRAARPLLGALRDADPFGLRSRALRSRAREERKLRHRVLGLLASTRLPGTAAWEQMDVEERSAWWVRRVGRLTSLVAAVPGFGGWITRRLPTTAALGAAAQGLVLCAVAAEHGVRDEAEQVALLGSVLFRRDLAPTPRAELTPGSNADVDARATELTGELAGEETPTLQRVAGAVWRMGRALLALEGELQKRPRGRFYHDWLSMLPAVGVVGKYFGEWSGLKRTARAGEAWLHTRGHPGGTR
jgi:hypothetical protein